MDPEKYCEYCLNRGWVPDRLEQRPGKGAQVLVTVPCPKCRKEKS